MNLEEYHALERVEREHWFYKGKRDLVFWWIQKVRGPLTANDSILDAGAGTGEFVRMLGAETPAKIIGVEFVEEARSIAKTVNGIELLPGSILELPIPDNSVDATCALDVLEHVEDDKKAFSELVRVTKPGGIIIVNVPAFMSLWSEWDVSLGHYRRYRKQMMREVLQSHLDAKAIEIVNFNYINFFAFPPILAYRTLRKIIPSDSRAEDNIPSPIINKLLYASFVTPAKLRWFRAPFGVSLFLVARKRR